MAELQDFHPKQRVHLTRDLSRETLADYADVQPEMSDKGVILSKGDLYTVANLWAEKQLIGISNDDGNTIYYVDLGDIQPTEGRKKKASPSSSKSHSS